MNDSDGKSLSAQGQHISDTVEVLEPAALASEMQQF